MSQTQLEYEILRLLKTYYDVQKLRLAVNNRVAVNRFTLCPSKHMVPLAEGSRDRCPMCGAQASVVTVEPPEYLVTVLRDLETMEKRLYRELESRVEGHPLYINYLQYVRGVGAATSAYLITVLNPARFETVS